MMKDEFLWVEKWRPKKIEDCILPAILKDHFLQFVENKQIPNLLLSGGPGVGKTTVARAMLEQCQLDYLMINGSMHGNIDTLRTDIKAYASSVSLMGTRKYVILDEADYLNVNTTQPALRGFMEEFSKNCGFILTCNFKNKILPALQSRTSVVDFNITNKDKPKLASEFMKRVELILLEEKISYNKQAVAEFIMKYFPDWRRVLNELQRYSATGHIDVGILSHISDDKFKALITSLRNKDFPNMRKWVGQNLDNDSATLFRKLYDSSCEYVKPESIPQLVLTIADYQYKAAFVADQEINLMACFTEIMARAKFK